MFKRKRAASPENHGSFTRRCLDGLRIGALEKVNVAKLYVLPDLIARLNADVTACQSSLASIQRLQDSLVFTDLDSGKTVENGKKNPRARDGNGGLTGYISTLHDALSHWSNDPSFQFNDQDSDRQRLPVKLQDIMLNVKVTQALEATKSLMYLNICEPSSK